MELLFNKYQTIIDDELIKQLPKSVYADLIDSIEHIPLINWLIQPEKVRGYAKDRPRHNSLPDTDDRKQYGDSRIVVDVTKPHILKDMDFFRERAIFYDKHGHYTDITPNPNPNSDYALFWREEVRRWKDGLIRPSDGEWIPGGLYFYWNYCPIWQSKKNEVIVKGRTKHRAKRVKSFPKPWLGDYLFYHYMEQALEYGLHGKLLKCRGVGFSFKMGSLSPRNMYVFTGTGNPNFHLASDKGFLSGDKGIFGKVIDTLDWIADNTPLPSLRLIDSARSMEIQLGYDDENGQRRGLLSSVFGISLKDNPDKARGIRGPLVHYEEDGLFPNLEEAWNINLKAVEDGDDSFGFQLAGGCVCAGTKVWNNEGKLVNIEDLYAARDEGILGYDGNGIYKEKIEWFKLPEEKPCYRIKTSGNNMIECSEDHPLLVTRNHWRVRTSKRNNPGGEAGYRGKNTTFTLAKDLKIGDQLLMIDEVPLFGDRVVKDARLLGLMIGDGNCTNGSTPQLSCGDDEIFEFVRDNYNYTIPKQFVKKTGGTYRSISIRQLIPILKQEGLYGKVKYDKTLPVNIHEYNKQSLSELLGGYYDADGNVTYNKKRDCVRVTLTSMVESLLNEVKYQLIKFGIHSTVQKEFRKDGYAPNTYIYRLYVTNQEDVTRFRNNIKFLCKHKQSILDMVINVNKKRDSSRLGNGIFKLNKDNNKGHYFIGNTNMKSLYQESIKSIEFIGNNVVYNMHTKTTNTYLSNMYITKQTGGTEGASFEGSQKLFYNPSAYSIYPVNNVYDKGVNQNNKCGFFWGAYMNRNNCYDIESGEPDVIKALIQIHTNRNKLRENSTDPNALTQKKAEEPITPQEAIMKTEGNLFPANDLREYLSEIKPNLPNFIASHTVGEFTINQTGVIFKTNDNITPIREYPLIDKGNMVGAVEIFELPSRNGLGNIMNFRYIAGIDPIDDDSSTTNSLPSIFIMDRFTNRIVAEYTGRPKFANDFYEICARMLLFYNATANYENDKKGLFGYFQQKGLMHLLCNTPTWLKDKQMIRGDNLYGNKAKGTNSGKEVNAAGRRLLKDWMLTTAYGEPEGGLMNLQKIRSIGLIEEAIMWNIDGNFDRISAMGMLMIYKEELYTLDVAGVETKRNKTLEDDFFKRCEKGYTKN